MLLNCSLEVGNWQAEEVIRLTDNECEPQASAAKTKGSMGSTKCRSSTLGRTPVDGVGQVSTDISVLHARWAGDRSKRITAQGWASRGLCACAVFCGPFSSSRPLCRTPEHRVPAEGKLEMSELNTEPALRLEPKCLGELEKISLVRIRASCLSHPCRPPSPEAMWTACRAVVTFRATVVAPLVEEGLCVECFLLEQLVRVLPGETITDDASQRTFFSKPSFRSFVSRGFFFFKKKWKFCKVSHTPRPRTGMSTFCSIIRFLLCCCCVLLLCVIIVWLLLCGCCVVLFHIQ